ncbi:MAG: glycosyltransferase family 1 protein [Bacteroidetes bacterium HGW-Bacteroidetes-6]|jgi:glycosyltransferase involved in cell wall biosynthesis|nr:MAG: glycosyltransferase family 1 protein [Bacteroidetes bacterium HGW-Bacteroidetes-6]
MQYSKPPKKLPLQIMSEPKILVISNYSGLNSSRPEAEIMIGLAKRGIEITIMTPPEAEYVARFEEAGIRVIGFQPKKKFDRNEIGFIRKELIAGEYNIIHLFNGKAIINGMKAAKGLPVKVILYRGYCGNIHWWDPTAYLKFLNSRADGIWCIAPAVEKLINRNRIFGKKTAFTIAKGHHPDWYKDVKPKSLSEFNIPQGAFVATMVANARPMKGLKYLIKATYKLSSNIPVYFLLIGNGLESAEIKKLVEKSPLKDRIIFTGYRNDSLELVKSSDVFVLSSLYGEAINKSVIEAMSVGVAPIITDIPGNQGLVIDGESGLVIPRKDPKAIAKAIERLFRNPDEKKKLAFGAKNHIACNYHIDKSIDQLHRYYVELLGK